MTTPRQNSSLNQFLNAARVRLEFWNTLHAAAWAVGAASLLAAPFVAYRMRLELPNGILIFGILIVASALFAALARRRAVRLAQVAEQLEIAPGDRDRIISAAEFLGADDPINRLAVQETEQWIDHEQAHLSRIKIRRSPFMAAGVILLLILLWRLTPGFHPRATHQQIALADSAPSSSAAKKTARTNSQSINAAAEPHRLIATPLPQPDIKISQMPGASSSPRPGGNNSGTGGQTPGTSLVPAHGGGNLPSNAPGRSSIPTPTLSRAPSGQSPAHRPRQEGNASTPGGAGHSAGGIPFAKVPTAILPPQQMHAVHTASASSIGLTKEREAIGDPTDIPAPGHAAPADVQFSNTVLDPTELESLPPGRRQLVIQYFRSMHEHADASPTTHP